MTGWAAFALLVKGTLVLAAGLGAARALRGRSAAIRHGTLVAATAAAVALPFLTLALPGWNLTLVDPDAGRSALSPTPADAPHAVASRTASAPRPATAAHEGPPPSWRGATLATPTPAPVMTLPRSADGRPPWLAWLLAVWATGTAFVLGRFAVDVERTRALLGEAMAAPDGFHARAAAGIAGRLGVRRPVRVLFSERLTVPVTWGVLRPVVVLPLEAWDWGPERVRIVLLHEIAHVRRMDCLSSGIAVLAAAVWWFHPLQWISRRRLRVEQERACDDVVLLDGVGPAAYASMLVDFARRLSPFEDRTTARAAIAMARRSTLRDRVETILATGSRSLRLEPRTAALLALVAAALLVPLAAVHVWGETAEARRTVELIGALESADPATREAAAWGLGAMGAEEAARPLRARLRDADPRVRGIAARSLGKVGGAPDFAPVARLLGDPDPFVRELAILALEELGGDALVPALVPLLSDPEMGVRAVAVSALGGVAGVDAARALVSAAESDPDGHTRGMAIGGLAKGAADRDVAVPALVGLLADADPHVRSSAAWGLAELGDQRAVAGLAARIPIEGDAGVRQEIIRSLGSFALAPPAVDALVAALGDPDGDVRSLAAKALAGSDDPRAAAALVAALRDPVHQVRLQAAWSLDEIEARR